MFCHSRGKNAVMYQSSEVGLNDSNKVRFFYESVKSAVKSTVYMHWYLSLKKIFLFAIVYEDIWISYLRQVPISAIAKEKKVLSVYNTGSNLAAYEMFCWTVRRKEVRLWMVNSRSKRNLQWSKAFMHPIRSDQLHQFSTLPIQIMLLKKIDVRSINFIDVATPLSNHLEETHDRRNCRGYCP